MDRILLITDSLGCPRCETAVEKTWTDRIIKDYTAVRGAYFYTYCEHGLSAVNLKLDWVAEIQPDIIIIQIGIVDACRRAFRRSFLNVIKRFPFLSRGVNWLARNYHYFLTRTKNIHLCDLRTFEQQLDKLAQISNKLAFITISEPGEFLIKCTYNVYNDVKMYNSVIDSVAKKYTHTVINPYRKTKDYLLADGHHLNECGNDAVYKAVSEWLNVNM